MLNGDGKVQLMFPYETLKNQPIINIKLMQATFKKTIQEQEKLWKLKKMCPKTRVHKFKTLVKAAY